jgi:hypothetical protein
MRTDVIVEALVNRGLPREECSLLVEDFDRRKLDIERRRDKAIDGKAAP